jgi:hypothetical protein
VLSRPKLVDGEVDFRGDEAEREKSQHANGGAKGVQGVSPVTSPYAERRSFGYYLQVAGEYCQVKRATIMLTAAEHHRSVDTLRVRDFAKHR